MSATTVPAKAEAKGPGLRRRLTDFSDRHRSTTVLVGVGLVAAALPLIVLLPPFNSFSGQNVWMDGFTIAGIFILLALGLNVVVGLSGLLDLGYAAFFAIGAYTYAFAASPFYNNSYPFWPMLLVGAGIAAIFGIMLGAPTLRLRGDYLAIVTLGFGEIIRVLILNIDKIGGARGFSGIPAWSNFFWVYFFCGITILISWRLVRSSVGRAWSTRAVACRETRDMQSARRPAAGNLKRRSLNVKRQPPTAAAASAGRAIG
jgi:ABC-type branched-subunit amino acid transport system permease subunit